HSRRKPVMKEPWTSLCVGSGSVAVGAALVAVIFWYHNPTSLSNQTLNITEAAKCSRESRDNLLYAISHHTKEWQHYADYIINWNSDTLLSGKNKYGADNEVAKSEFYFLVHEHSQKANLAQAQLKACQEVGK